MRRIPASLLLAVSLAIVGVAGAVQAQTPADQPIAATVEAQDTSPPDALPGVYEADLVVTVEAAGDQCTCTETEVTVIGNSSVVESFTFEPGTYTIDWTQHDGAHEQEVAAELDVDQLDGDGQATIDVEMSHEPDPGKRSQTDPAEITLEEPETTGATANGTTAANGSEETQTQSAETGGDEEADGVPAPAAAPLAAALAGAALLRRSRP